MRTEAEIRQAISDLMEAQPYNIRAEGLGGPSFKLAYQTMDVLRWVIGEEQTTTGIGLQALRSITASRKAGTN